MTSAWFQVTPIRLADKAQATGRGAARRPERAGDAVLVQSLDLLGAQRNARVTPAETDVGVVPFGFSQVADVANKAERFPKIAEAEGSFDTVAIIVQFPIRSLRPKMLRFCQRERRKVSASRGAFLLGERLGHGFAPPTQRGGER